MQKSESQLSAVSVVRTAISKTEDAIVKVKQELIDEVVTPYIRNICETHNIDFVSSMGTYFFSLSPKDRRQAILGTIIRQEDLEDAIADYTRSRYEEPSDDSFTDEELEPVAVMVKDVSDAYGFVLDEHLCGEEIGLSVGDITV